MSFRNVYMMLTCASLTLSACTRGQQNVQIEPAKKPETSGQQGGSNADQGQSVGDKSGAVGIVLNKQALQKYAINLDNLNYKFTYLDQKQENKITFDAAGKAQLKFTNLPSDTAGTVTLEVLEGTTVKLRGSVENVTLKKGENTTVALTLKEVDPNGGGNGNGNNNTTDLTIDVTLDNNTGGTPPTGGNGSGNGTGSGSGSGSGAGSGSGSGAGAGSDTTPNTGGSGGTADPIASWDGKSNLGNSKWSVTPAVVGAAALH